MEKNGARQTQFKEEHVSRMVDDSTGSTTDEMCNKIMILSSLQAPVPSPQLPLQMSLPGQAQGHHHRPVQLQWHQSQHQVPASGTAQRASEGCPGYQGLKRSKPRLGKQYQELFHNKQTQLIEVHSTKQCNDIHTQLVDNRWQQVLQTCSNKKAND